MGIMAKFQQGNNVRIISSGKIGTINAVIDRGDRFNYKVTVEGKIYNYLEKYLEVYVDEEQEIYDSFIQEEFSDAEDYRIFNTWYRLKRPIEGNLYSFLSSKTIFNPYQFKPLLKFINPDSEYRLFIADEVGVGKTIETGIIFTELIARGKLDRRKPILIICPNSLGPKWVSEMKSRFNLKFHLHDGNSLYNMLSSAQSTGVIPEEYSWSVVSIQTLRYEKYFNMLNNVMESRLETIFSMVVVDESHHMRNAGTESNSIGHMLSKLSDMMIMLSATPLNLRSEDLFNQLNILNPSLFPDINTFEAMTSPLKAINSCRKLIMTSDNTLYAEILDKIHELKNGILGQAIKSHEGIVKLENKLMSRTKITAEEAVIYDRMLTALSPLDSIFTRTLKREAIEHKVLRETNKIPVVLSKKEYEFQRDFIDVIKKSYLERGGADSALGFVLNTPYRMVSSCIPATKEYIDWCLDNNRLSVINGKGEDLDDDSEANVEYIELPEYIRLEFVRLKAEAKNLGDNDSKYNELKKYLKKLLPKLENKQIIIFSFFIKTLKYLEEKLTQDGYRVGVINGHVPVVSKNQEPSRYSIIEEFKNGEIDILLSSEVGGEGLDFQFCQALLNYDMPYNPMRIEQRIGRIDRFGQKANKIIVASMYIKDTIDERIYELLYERIKIVEENIGDMQPILGEKLLNIQNEIISGKLTEEDIKKLEKTLEIAIEQAKLESEKFERNRDRLLGDEYFSRSIVNMDKTDFVKPEDAVQLTKIFLALVKGCKYDEIDSTSGKLTISKELCERVQEYTRRPGSEGSMLELSTLIEKKKNINVIFDGSKAVSNSNFAFLPPSGYWIRFILRELENMNKIKKVFMLEKSSDKTDINKGKYLVPLFEVKIEGFRTELSLSAVPVDIKGKFVADCSFEEFARNVYNSVDKNSIVIPELSQDELMDYIEIGRDALNNQIEEKVRNLRLQHKYKLEARISSLEKAAAMRISKINNKIKEYKEKCNIEGKTPNSEFIRLEEAKVTNELNWKEEKIKSLKEKQDISVNTSVSALILLSVI